MRTNALAEQLQYDKLAREVQYTMEREVQSQLDLEFFKAADCGNTDIVIKLLSGTRKQNINRIFRKIINIV